MKRLFLSLALAVMTLSSSTAAFAQQRANTDALLSKLEKNTGDTQDAKKGAKASTWLTRGDLLYQIATANVGPAYEGMTEQEAVLLLGRPTNAAEVPIEEIGGKEYKKYVYDGLDVYFDAETGKAAFWKETKTTMENALGEAVKAYEKAAQLDPKVKDKAKDALVRIINQYKIDGQNLYAFSDFKGASEAFAQAGAISESPLVNQPDYEILYFAGVAACQGEEYQASIDYLEKALKGNYTGEGMIYYYLAYDKSKLDDKAGAEAALLEGVQKYPANQTLLEGLISHYIANNDDPSKVIPYIKKAQENDPDNVIMYVAEGVAYESMKDYPKAEAAYQKAIEMKPDFFDPIYNLGLLYNLQGEEAVQELRTIDYTNQQAYTEKENEAIDYFKKSVALFEKAHELKPDDANTIQLARTLYFRLRDEGPEMQAGYDKYDALQKQLQQ